MKSLSLLALAGGLSLTTAATAGPGIVINEYLYDPAPDETGDANQDTVINTSQDEFVELVNTSASPIDLSGWTLEDSVTLRHTFPGGTVVGAGCAIVVFGGGHPPINLFGGAIVQTASSGLLGLNNDGDSITVKDAGAAVIATLTYPNASNVDESFTRDPDKTGAFVKHSLATGSGGALFSPGVKIDGSPFGSCVLPGPDADGDGHPDEFDNCPSLPNPDQADCDGNGIGDVCDIADDPSLDCNLNGIVDSCEADCNNSGFPDDCDITLGISLDCNGNSIPDECETDCNGNLIPDDCDIASGFSQDADNDGIPDECQNPISIVINEVLADPPAGLTGDANHDGVPSSGNNQNDEFVEIVNVSGTSVDISGWALHDAAGGGAGTVRHIFPLGTVIPNNCGVVVFGGGTPIGQWNGMQAQVASTGTLSLNNDVETIALRDAKGLLVDTMTYGGATGLNGGDDQSLTRSPDVTGPFVKHGTAQPGVIYSPGSKTDGTAFGGCPAILPDTDNDGIPDVDDNCDTTANPFQEDCDKDGIGDACDTDPDSNGNGIPDICEITTPGNVRINEIRIDQPSTDNDEYVEIKGPAGLSLNGLTYIVLGDGTGGSGVIEAVVSLAGHSIPADGHFLVCENTATGLIPAAQRDFVLSSTGLNFENSDNVTHILVTNFTGADGQDLDTDNNGTIDIHPWSDVVDAVGIIGTGVPGASGVEYAYGPDLGGVNVGPDTTFVPGQVYRCETTGTWIVGKFDPLDPTGGTDTPGTLNLACAGNPCPADIDASGTVDIDDLFLVINNWGACAGCAADIDHNGVVDIDDLFNVINAWGLCP